MGDHISLWLAGKLGRQAKKVHFRGALRFLYCSEQELKFGKGILLRVGDGKGPRL